MHHLQIIIEWFCYGWTFVTFPVCMFLVTFSLWADYKNKKDQQHIKKMMTEDPD